jgi:hypothetical protein
MCRFVDDGTLRLWRTRADVTTGETWAVEKVPLQKKAGFSCQQAINSSRQFRPFAEGGAIV